MIPLVFLAIYLALMMPLAAESGSLWHVKSLLLLILPPLFFYFLGYVIHRVEKVMTEKPDLRFSRTDAWIVSLLLCDVALGLITVVRMIWRLFQAKG